MEIIKVQSKQQFIEASVELISSEIISAIKKRGSCVLGLSGGSTPKPVYEALGKRPEIDWEKVTIIVLDERYVPASHPDSNVGMMMSTLLASPDTKKAALIAPDTKLPLDECVNDFARQLDDLTIDVAVLGMGEDGHIASLFPPLTEPAFGPAKAIHSITDHFAVRDRITVTLPVIKSAGKKLFLISGENKVAIMEKIAAGDQALPAGMVSDGETEWLVFLA